MILRPDYISAIEPFIDVQIVKILAGVRRCGKSTILEMVCDILKNRGVSPENIITRRYNTMTINDDFTAADMFDDLNSSVSGKGRCYLLLDELQEIDGWEKAVNNLLESCDVDIYVTGSNSKLMSSEIATYLSGRYVTIPVYTLSFREYLSFKGKSVSEARTIFDEYVQYGGFPLISISNFNTNTAYQIVEDIYASVVSNDISKRHQIRNTELFNRVVKYIIDNVGNTFSASAIIKFLKSENRSLTVEAIYNYLKWLSDAFVIYPCQRYDLQGKAILKTQEKYYLSDISFKYSLFGFDRKALSAMFENIVFLEMKRRGYKVYIGKNGTKEIDFVATRRDEKIYVQVCVELPTQSTRETDNLMDIKDHYHKYVVCRDPLALGNDNGIEIVHIADFLLRENW
jgi:predicted AAA+ superfamily ATPase